MKKEYKANGAQLYIRLTTDETSEERLKDIFFTIIIKNPEPDAIWVYMHKPNKEPYGDLIVEARTANRQEGAKLIGVKDPREHIFEMKK